MGAVKAMLMDEEEKARVQALDEEIEKKLQHGRKCLQEDHRIREALSTFKEALEQLTVL